MELDVPRLQTKIHRKFVPENFNQIEGVAPIQFLDKCKQSGIFEFHLSHDIHGIDNLMAYFKSRGQYLNNKRLVLLQYSSENSGHAVGLKLSIEEGVRDPSMLLVDYQQPPFLKRGLVNPFRFTSMIDTLNYKVFVVISLI